jgi:hypothetical protein
VKVRVFLYNGYLLAAEMHAIIYLDSGHLLDTHWLQHAATGDIFQQTKVDYSWTMTKVSRVP